MIKTAKMQGNVMVSAGRRGAEGGIGTMKSVDGGGCRLESRTSPDSLRPVLHAAVPPRVPTGTGPQLQSVEDQVFICKPQLCCF